MPGSQTSSSTDFGESLPGGIRIRETASGVVLHFPPGRSPEVALALGAFGVICGGLSALALLGLVAPGSPTIHDFLTIVLAGVFIAPFLLFGLAFVAIAFYMLANSLTVVIENGRIETVRAMFGVPVVRRSMRCADVRSIEAQIPARHQSPFSAEPRYRLVARGDPAGRSALVVAEDVRGESLMARLRSAVGRAACLANPPGTGA